jgi:hypothetical protein
VDLVRETRTDHLLSPPLVQVRADSELALASLLGLGSAHAARFPGVHPTRAGVAVGLLLGLALVLAMISVGSLL